jgi:hypothetical protein
METIAHTELASRCRDVRAPNRQLDGEIFRTLEAKEGDVWSDMFGDDDVWHRNDAEDRAAWDGPAPYTGSIDAVDAARRAHGLRLDSLREHIPSDIGASDPDWRPCGATVSDGMRVHDGRGHSLATAYMDAVLMALAAK